MKLNYFLTFILIFSSSIQAETELSSHKNVFPFKYKPAPNIELTLTKQNNSIKVVYPDGNTEEITTLETKNWNDNYNVTKDLNFDGYIDLALWVSVNPRGLNESYDIFIWDEKALKLKKVINIINPSIESNFLIENVIDTTCQNKAHYNMCPYMTRYIWRNNSLVIHSTLSSAEDNQMTIRFYDYGKIVKTVTVPNEQINIETEKWLIKEGQ